MPHSSRPRHPAIECRPPQNTTVIESGGSNINRFSQVPQQATTAARQVLARYAFAASVTSLTGLGAAGGFSGALLWRCRAAAQDWCLRGWPLGGVSAERLTWIHTELTRLAAECRWVPTPIQSTGGPSWVELDGRLWEISPWVPGSADFAQNPSAERLVAACGKLAEIHLAARHAGECKTARSPSIATRLEFVVQLDGGLWRAIHEAVSSRASTAFAPRARQLLAAYAQRAAPLRAELTALESTQFALHTCHGDLWHDHVLYNGPDVSGFIDFGAMRIDSPASDLARLLGSLAKDDRALWDAGFAAYASRAPLNDAERRLAVTIDHANVLLAGMNWLKWLFIEQRQFEDPQRVQQRLDAILERAPTRWA